MKTYITNHLTTLPKSFAEIIHQTSSQHPLSFQQQEIIINSLPNDSASGSRRGLLRSSYFSVGSQKPNSFSRPKYLPTSVRNKILFHFTHSEHDKIKSILASLNEPIQLSPKRAQQSSSRTREHHSSDQVQLPDMPHTFELPEISNSSSSSTPYIRFLNNIVEGNGTLEWRIHTPKTDIIVINDIDITPNIFQKNSFVHLTRSVNHTHILYDCKCNMFNVLNRTTSYESSTGDCLHIRLFKEHIEPIYDKLFSDSSSIILTPLKSKIVQSLQSLNIPIRHLGCYAKFHKYSVVSQNFFSCAIVKLHENRISCTSGLCLSKKGHSRKIKIIHEGGCEHLKTMADHNEIWQSHITENDGTLPEEATPPSTSRGNVSEFFM
jgi:hypothetical protein